VVHLVVVPIPDHEATVVGRLLGELQHVVVEVLLEHVRVLVRLGRRHDADEHAAGRVRRGPLLPRLPVGPGALEVAVQADVDAGDEPRGERRLRARVRVRAPHRGRQRHPEPAAVAPVVGVEAPGQLVVVAVHAALVDVQVDAVQRRVAERAAQPRARAAQVGVPQVRGEVRRRPRGREGVAGAGAGVGVGRPADGEEHEDALGLAVLDVGADARERVAREVERVVGGAVAEAAEEGDDDGGVGARVAGLAQRALVLVPAPEDGHVARAGGGQRQRAGCRQQGEEEDAARTPPRERHCYVLECGLMGEDCGRGARVFMHGSE
jgi:hypothetical protein